MIGRGRVEGRGERGVATYRSQHMSCSSFIVTHAVDMCGCCVTGGREDRRADDTARLTRNDTHADAPTHADDTALTRQSPSRPCCTRPVGDGIGTRARSGVSAVSCAYDRVEIPRLPTRPPHTNPSLDVCSLAPSLSLVAAVCGSCSPPPSSRAQAAGVCGVSERSGQGQRSEASPAERTRAHLSTML